MIHLQHTMPNDHAEALLVLLDAITEGTADIIINDAVRLEPEEEDTLTRALAVAKTLGVSMRKQLVANYNSGKPPERNRDRQQEIIHRGRAILFARMSKERGVS